MYQNTNQNAPFYTTDASLVGKNVPTNAPVNAPGVTPSQPVVLPPLSANQKVVLSTGAILSVSPGTTIVNAQGKTVVISDPQGAANARVAKVKADIALATVTRAQLLTQGIIETTGAATDRIAQETILLAQAAEVRKIELIEGGTADPIVNKINEIINSINGRTTPVTVSVLPN